MTPIVLHVDHTPTDQEIVGLGVRNPTLRFGRNADGSLTISLKSRSTGLEDELYQQLRRWNYTLPKRGQVFEPWTAFSLADGSLVAPTVAWLHPDRLNEHDHGQAPLALCPDLAIGVVPYSFDTHAALHSALNTVARHGAFVTAVVDPFDRITSLREKLQRSVDRSDDLIRIEPCILGLPSSAFTLTLDLARLRRAYENLFSPPSTAAAAS